MTIQYWFFWTSKCIESCETSHEPKISVYVLIIIRIPAWMFSRIHYNSPNIEPRLRWMRWVPRTSKKRLVRCWGDVHTLLVRFMRHEDHRIYVFLFFPTLSFSQSFCSCSFTRSLISLCIRHIAAFTILVHSPSLRMFSPRASSWHRETFFLSLSLSLCVVQHLGEPILRVGIKSRVDEGKTGRENPSELFWKWPQPPDLISTTQNGRNVWCCCVRIAEWHIIDFEMAELCGYPWLDGVPKLCRKRKWTKRVSESFPRCCWS